MLLAVCFAGAVYLVALLPCALCQSHPAYIFPCNESAYLVAKTNQVPTTIRTPENTGACQFTLFCANAKGKIEGTQLMISKDVHVISFSCGSTATHIQVRSTERSEQRGEMSYAP